MTDDRPAAPRLEHIGIAVRELEIASRRYEALLGVPPSAIEELPSEGVRLCFFALPNCRVELIEPLDATSALSRSLERRGEGLHHIALSTDSLPLELNRLASRGIDTIGPPRCGSGGADIAFVHPRDAHGVLVEWTATGSEDR